MCLSQHCVAGVNIVLPESTQMRTESTLMHTESTKCVLSQRMALPWSTKRCLGQHCVDWVNDVG